MLSSSKPPHIIDTEASTNAALVSLKMDKGICKIEESKKIARSKLIRLRRCYYDDAKRQFFINSKAFRSSPAFPNPENRIEGDPYPNRALRRFTAARLGLIDKSGRDKEILDTLFISWNQGLLGTLLTAISFNTAHLGLFPHGEYIGNLQRDEDGVFLDVVLFNITIDEPPDPKRGNPTKYRVPGIASLRFRLIDEGFLLEKDSLQCSNQLLKAFYSHDAENFAQAVPSLDAAIEAAVLEELESFQDEIKYCPHKKMIKEIYLSLENLISTLLAADKVNSNLSIFYNIITFVKRIIANQYDELAHAQLKLFSGQLKELCITETKNIMKQAQGVEIQKRINEMHIPEMGKITALLDQLTIDFRPQHQEDHHNDKPVSETHFDWLAYGLASTSAAIGLGGVIAFVVFNILTSGAALPIFTAIGVAALSYTSISTSVIAPSIVGAILFTAVAAPVCAAVCAAAGYVTGKVGSFIARLCGKKSLREENYIALTPMFSDDEGPSYTSTRYMLELSPAQASNRKRKKSDDYDPSAVRFSAKKKSCSCWSVFCCIFTPTKKKKSRNVSALEMDMIKRIL